MVRRRRGQHGFTLIELLVVVTILGILAAVVVFSVRGIGDKGQNAAALTDIQTIRTAEEAMCANLGHYGTGTDLVSAGLLTRAPTLHTVVATSGGNCTKSGDPNKSGFAIACPDNLSCSQMNVGAQADQYQLDPNAGQGTTATLGQYPQDADIFESLITLSPTYQLVPTLAVGWVLIPAATARTTAGGAPLASPYSGVDTWRFYLRPSVQFQNGAGLMTATAVKNGMFDLHAAIGGDTIMAGGPTNPNSGQTTESAQVVDDTCTAMTGTPNSLGTGATSNCVIDFTPTSEDLRIPEQIVHPVFGVVAPGHFAGESAPGTADWNNPAVGPVGTGPFSFVNYTPNQKIVVARNPTYWGTKALLKGITFQFFGDNAAREAALQAHQVDFAYELPLTDVATLKTAGFVASTSAAGAYQTLQVTIHPDAAFTAGQTSGPGDPNGPGITCGNGAATAGNPGACHDLLADLSIRQAIDKAINRSDLVNVNYAGLATTDQSQVPPSVLAPHQSLVTGYSFDLAGANALLNADGWTGPTTTVDGVATRTKNFGGVTRALVLTLQIGFPNPAAQLSVPAYLQNALKAIGIDLRIGNDGSSDGGEFNAIINGSADMTMEVGNQNDANPAFLPSLLYYTGPGSFSFGYQDRYNPDTACTMAPPTACGGDQVFNQAIWRTLTQDVTDDSVRQDTASAMHDLIDTKAINIVLVGLPRTYMMTSKVIGFVAHPSFLNTQWAGVSLTS